MTQRLKALTAAALFAALTSACSNPQNSTPINVLKNVNPSNQKSAEENPALRVVDPNGAPVSGARVMIGWRSDQPFINNILNTDNNGLALLPPAWTSTEPVTIEAPGYVRATFLEQTPRRAGGSPMVYRLHRQPTSLNFELRGETTGYRNLSSDGTVDIGLVLPTVGRNQLSTMLLTDLVEREIDPVTIHGYTIALPSNLAMPTQQESYFFIPVEISKPSFRSYYPAAGPYAVETVHARFKVNEMVDAVKNKVSLLELLNGFTFTEGSLSDITIRKGSLQTNLPVNGISFQPLIPVVAPAYDNKLAMMAIAMMEKDGNYFLSDVKKIKSQGRATLSAAPNHMQRGLVVRILRFDRPNGADALIGQESVKMSMILSPTNRSDVSSFIEIAPSPSLRKGSLGLTPPRKINGLTPTATYVVLSRVEVNQSNQYKLERVFPQWEVYATDWPSNIELPEMPNIPMPEGKMRWEALFAGQPTRMVNGPLEAGPDTMEKATHVSRTAIDF